MHIKVPSLIGGLLYLLSNGYIIIMPRLQEYKNPRQKLKYSNFIFFFLEICEYSVCLIIFQYIVNQLYMRYYFF